jgi:hypothetical protein
MKDLVSMHWAGVVGLVASMSVAFAVFVPHGFIWTGLAWGGLAACAAVFLSTRSTRSIRRVIDDIEAEPVQAPMPARVGAAG